MEQGVFINFGTPTFAWSSEAKGRAAVHCVVIGFSTQKSEHDLNPYLLRGPVVFLEKRRRPICDVPEMGRGNEPTDGGHLLLSEEEYRDILAEEPSVQKYVKRFSMGEEFLHNIPRYCLWLVNADPGEIKKMPRVMERVERVRKMRIASKRRKTQELARTPTLFERTNHPEQYLVLPKVSSERRDYIPIGYLDSNTIVGDTLFYVPNASLYHFGVMCSSVHMAWVRAVCGRLEMRYRYSRDIVYNNFPWPDATDERKATIEQHAQAVLNARSRFPDSSLADLYDPLTMPACLLKAHQALDRAVMKLYGFSSRFVTEAQVVAALMELYQAIVKSKGERT